MGNSCESLVDGYGKNQAENRKETQNYLYNSCCCFMMFICLIVGFISGGIVGVHLEKNQSLEIFRSVLERANLQDSEERSSDLECVIKSVNISERPKDCGFCTMSR